MLVFYLSMLENEVDKRNFERIYLTYHDDILRRTYNILRNDEDVKDAMQETWIRVLKSMSLFRDKDEASIRAYIMSIARNQSISILRKKRREAELFSETDCAERIDDTDFFELCESEGVSRVMACILMLSEAQKEVIMMYYLYDRSIKEIAALFGISPAVAESRWTHGRERLATLLGRRGIYVKKDHERQ